MTIDGLKELEKLPKSFVEFVKTHDVPVEFRKLNGARGIADFDKVYVDPIKCETVEMLMYVTLHEIGHSKRWARVGREQFMKNFTEQEFEDFFEFIINEEIIADRYAGLTYRVLTGESTKLTQGLEEEWAKEQYRQPASAMHMMIKTMTYEQALQMVLA